MEANKRVFLARYSQYARRQGDLYVMRESNGWHINAGVDPFGHDPGYGVAVDIVYSTPEFDSFQEFLKRTAEVQKFIISELGATQQSCNKIFEEIWDYIHKRSPK